MASRLKLQARLEEILGSENVYFQPPASIKMKYPAIRYNLSRIDLSHADDSIYKQDVGYTITLIDYSPDSEYVQKILLLPKCRFDRAYAADNLNHYTFTIYY